MKFPFMYRKIYMPHIFIPEKKTYQILLLCILVLLIYYPAIFAEISIIDDLGMVNDILNSDTISLSNIFVPRSVGGGYYRPLLGLSQYIDKQLWMMSSSFMHLENILFHLVNILLVYLLTLRLSGRLAFKIDSLLPFVTALVFAIHPIVTESVNWISGRTDIMACNFILVSTIFLFSYLDRRKKLDLFCSGTALLLSLLAKEVAFGFILAVPFLLVLPQRDVSRRTIEPVVLSTRKVFHPLIIYLLFFSVSVIIVLYIGSYWSVLFLGCCFMLYSLWTDIGNKPLQVTIREHFAVTILLALVGLVTGTLFFVFRKIAFSSNIDRISNTLNLIFQDTSYAISIFLGAAGYYVKKFFLPLPLNFFILEINPLYDLLGIAVFLLTLWLVLRRNTISALAITGMCCVLPAFPFAFGTIAWTGYAERYIYIASAFWSISVSLFVAQLIAERNIRNATMMSVHVVVYAFLIVMSFVTYQRNITWQTNMALIADTVSKNPRQKELRGLYMLAFIRAGELKSAREQYFIASSLPSNKYMDNYDINMAGIEATEGNKEKAEALLQKVLSATKGKSAAALKFYINFQENELLQAKDPNSIRNIQDKIISLYNQSYLLIHDPFIFYRLGQIYIARGDKPKAIQMYEQAAKAYPPGNMYGDNSSKIVQKLKKQMQL
ncbi:MAG: hypothetical protein A2X82_14860 [Geobacteraceae bacterium GWC2_55_20]|nr:MAG: hypothetical protein A2X82_14860 [Geobacteraceae bacterium GWC2_55_20]OGU24377.1 MAG: hypothetical protein A2X85_14775 [Geobacteraceae bacterium GWF2_54_21]